MTIEQIFKDEPVLMEAKSVKNLIEYVSGEHMKLLNMYKQHSKFHDKVLEICMNSELMILNGYSHKDAIIKIMDLIEKSDL